MQISFKFGYSQLRKGRRSDSGRIYLVTTTTADRQPLFHRHDLARIVARTTSAPGVWGSSRLLAWVLMPDHWHGLIQIGDQDRLSDMLQRFKGISARRVNQFRGSSDSVWNRGFHDQALGSDDDFHAVVRYVIANPVRAGLCPSIWSYSYWDAQHPEGFRIPFDELMEDASRMDRDRQAG